MDGDLLAVANVALRSWRDVIPVHPAAETIPSIVGDDFARLKADIAIHGLQVPVVVVRDGDAEFLLDGRSRLDAMEAVGIRTVGADSRLAVSIEIFEPTKKQSALDYVRSLNVHRRHLKQSQIRKAIEAELIRDPARSDRAIARDVGATNKTVGKAREDLEGRSEIPNTDTRTDSTGRHQPARKPRTKRTAGAAPTAAEPAQSREEIPHADGEPVYQAGPISDPGAVAAAEKVPVL